MHLLVSTPGQINDIDEAIDLGQDPADIIFMSHADTDIITLAQIVDEGLFSEFSIRATNFSSLNNLYSTDLYIEKTIEKSKVIIIRCLGGISYSEYQINEIHNHCKKNNKPLIILSGDNKIDEQLLQKSTIDVNDYHQLNEYFKQGGKENITNAIKLIYSKHINNIYEFEEPKIILETGKYSSSIQNDNGAVAIIFYKSLLQSGATLVIDEVVKDLEEKNINHIAIYTSSLKDDIQANIITNMLIENNVQFVINTTSFCVGEINGTENKTPFTALNCPVAQIILSNMPMDNWIESTTGLGVKDITMNIAMPEIDGRIISNAASFKGLPDYNEKLQTTIVQIVPVLDRISNIVNLAKNYLGLQTKKNSDKTIALIFANYPNKNSRVGNGVGLDSPQSSINILKAMEKDGYKVPTFQDGNEIIEYILSGTTNDTNHSGEIRVTITKSQYNDFFDKLSSKVKTEIIERWGKFEDDPFYMPDNDSIALTLSKIGNIYLGIQPARGYNINPIETYHSPDLVPPHYYIGFYAYLQKVGNVDAIINIGKHGNLEWLPGKGNGLSKDCYSDFLMGQIPNFYPFIINDPGEGTQAKRRTSSVIISHLTPPMVRAESYGDMIELERLIDEYYQASINNDKRLNTIKEDIFDLIQITSIGDDLGIKDTTDKEKALEKIDGYICELKEMQIRNGLHIFGENLSQDTKNEFVCALARLDRGNTKNENMSLIKAIAHDFGLIHNPFKNDFSKPWDMEKPEQLLSICDEPWRTYGDALERFELFALSVLEDNKKSPGNKTAAVLKYINNSIIPNLEMSSKLEISNLIAGLNGRFVPAGPSGAPTRGKPEILPTGNNFYSVDPRNLPTPSAWKVGFEGASLIIEKYLQENGNYPKHIAISAWGTSNIRTGGDDIAQAFALIGAKPTWDNTSKKVIGYEILPLSILNRPRIDITLRISGFFRDAFPEMISLLDNAIREIIHLDESEKQNYLKLNYNKTYNDMSSVFENKDEMEFLSSSRIFGSKPGSYGAGMQAMIDEDIWKEKADFANTYVEWGSYIYSSKEFGKQSKDTLKSNLSSVDIVVQNQDNREHDILDSDDYYQFQGGLVSAVTTFNDSVPQVYFNDTSKPESINLKTLEEEISKVVRGRAANPKWIKSIMEHGYKGAFEMSATVDYLYAFAATTHCVSDHHFEQIANAYINDDEVYKFLQNNNPNALKDILKRLNDALERGLWENPLSNSLIQKIKGDI